MAKKWEHTFLYQEIESEQDVVDTIVRLNNLGQQGWECCGFTTLRYFNASVIMLKREITDA